MLLRFYRLDKSLQPLAKGNTLTLQETKIVLEGITIGGKTLREHFEVINHKEAVLYVEELISNKGSLTEHVIKQLHHLILKNIRDRDAGKYREINVFITVVSMFRL